MFVKIGGKKNEFLKYVELFGKFYEFFDFPSFEDLLIFFRRERFKKYL